MVEAEECERDRDIEGGWWSSERERSMGREEVVVKEGLVGVREEEDAHFVFGTGGRDREVEVSVLFDARGVVVASLEDAVEFQSGISICWPVFPSP